MLCCSDKDVHGPRFRVVPFIPKSYLFGWFSPSKTPYFQASPACPTPLGSKFSCTTTCSFSLPPSNLLPSFMPTYQALELKKTRNIKKHSTPLLLAALFSTTHMRIMLCLNFYPGAGKHHPKGSALPKRAFLV